VLKLAVSTLHTPDVGDTVSDGEPIEGTAVAYARPEPAVREQDPDVSSGSDRKPNDEPAVNVTVRDPKTETS